MLTGTLSVISGVRMMVRKERVTLSPIKVVPQKPKLLSFYEDKGFFYWAELS